MILAQLPAGAQVFVHADTLNYPFTPHRIFGSACHDLMDRIVKGKLIAATAAHVLGEVALRLMVAEALSLPGWASGKTPKRLKHQPAIVQQLTLFRQAVDELLQSPLQVYGVAPVALGSAAVLSQQFGLLTNDSLTVAVMQQHGLTNIAGHDADFNRVPGIIRCGPA